MIGYSFGAVLGTELARLFEKIGKKVNFISLDGSLSLFKKYLNIAMRTENVTEENLDNWFAYSICFQILPNMSKPEILKMLSEDKTIEEKLKAAVTLIGVKKYSDDFLIKSYYGMSNRIKALIAATEKPSEIKLKTNILLIQPKVKLLNDMSSDYDLKKYTEGDVVIHSSDKRHFTLLEDQNVIDLIHDICKK